MQTRFVHRTEISATVFARTPYLAGYDADDRISTMTSMGDAAAAAQRIEPGKECGGIVRANRPLPASEQACISHQPSVGVAAYFALALHSRFGPEGQFLLHNRPSTLSTLLYTPILYLSYVLTSFLSNLSLLLSNPSMSSHHPILAGSAKFPKPADQAFQYGTAGVSQSALTVDTGRLSVRPPVSHESVSIPLPIAQSCLRPGKHTES